MGAFSLVAVLAATVLAQSGCGQQCTLVGCSSESDVFYLDPIEGEYSLTIGVEPTGFSQTVDCPGSYQAFEAQGITQALVCDESGFSMRDGQVDEATELSVMIVREGATVHDAVLELEEVTVFAPNGEDCGPVCRITEAEL